MAILQKTYLGATKLWRDTEWYESFLPELVSSSFNVTVTANSAAHTKGAWTQLIASTASDSSHLRITISNVAIVNTNTSTLLDLAIGASGGEIPIASNICIGGCLSSILDIPLQIPSGTRISARIQSTVTGGKTATLTASVLNFYNYLNAPTSIDVINPGDISTSKGTAFSGASGTWVEAVSSSSRAYKAVGMIFSVHTDSSSSMSAAAGIFEIGVGAAGGEISSGKFRFSTTVNENFQNGSPSNLYAIIGRSIPVGSRISVKHPIPTNPERYGFCLIGIP